MTDRYKLTIHRQRPTDLMKAVQDQDVALVGELIARGDSVAATDSYGQTALHWASKYESLEIARRLLGAGARADTPDEDGDTPLDNAERRGNEAMVDLLKGGG
jgi:ankyrin repeat protein